MLSVQDIHAGYGGSRVLCGVSFGVAPGEIVVLLGRNGSGRSTTAKVIMGLLPATGRVDWRGEALLGRPPHEIARRGVGYVPEARDVFPTLTVEQNLELGWMPRRRGMLGRRDDEPLRRLKEDVYALFPWLKARADTLAGVLSGGEQQMLSLGRTLMGQPQLMVVDEPMEGLAPQAVQQVAGFVHALRQRGLAVLLIEQKFSLARTLADRCLVFGHGRVVFEGSHADLDAADDVRREWLEV